MCKQSSSLTLEKALLLQVHEFAKENVQFSMHDITRHVRRKASDGTWEIPEVQVTGAAFKHDIPHVKVKDLFKQLWQSGAFDPYLSLSQSFNGTYFVFTPTLLQVVVQQPSPVVSPTTPSQTPATTNLPPNPSKDVPDRIKIYLRSCLTKNVSPTLRQVQSAIKRGNRSSGWTCERIGNYIEDELKQVVSIDPDFVSMSQVLL